MRKGEIMLNQTTEHAIRALLYLAQRPAGESVAAERIAAGLGAPANYLAKTLNALVKQGLVASSRGPAGGFRLRRAAHQITLTQVVEIFGEARPQPVCLLGDRPCRSEAPCAAHARWESINVEMRRPLDDTTLADLLAQPHPRLAGELAGIRGQAASAA
jgi:Rrf2 family transcriptional regulator, iron-sulfur cluster assembly transcription factor